MHLPFDLRNGFGLSFELNSREFFGNYVIEVVFKPDKNCVPNRTHFI